MDRREQFEAHRLEQDILRRLNPSYEGQPRGAQGDEETAELADLAVRLRSELTPPEPSPIFVATSRARLENRLRALRSSEAKPRRSASRGLVVVRRLAFACLSLFAVLALSTAGVAYAAQGSLPGDSLYGVKLGVEHARLALTPDTGSRLQLLTSFAGERIAEADVLIGRNREADLGLALDEYQAEIDSIQTLAANLPAPDRATVLAAVQLHLQQHIDVLEAVRNQAPPAAQPALDRAIENSTHSQDVLQQIEAGNSPSELAPGQLKKTEMPGGDQGPHGPPATPPGKSKH